MAKQFLILIEFIRRKSNPLGLAIKLAAVVTPIIRWRENKFIDSNLLEKPTHFPVFIIGPPRSGTTIFYQALTNYYKVSYISNVVHVFYRTLLYGFKKHDKRYNDKPHDNFKSDFGFTWKYGMNAPSECGEFWKRGMNKGCDYVKAGEMDESIITFYRNSIYPVLQYFQRPLIIKNLMLGQRIGFLKEVFPNAKFILIKRDVVKNAISIMKARKQKGVSTNEVWSVKPKGYKELIGLPESEMVVRQIDLIEKQIFMDFRDLPPEDYRVISFEEFSADPVIVLEKLVPFLGKKLTKRNNAKLPDIYPYKGKK